MRAARRSQGYDGHFATAIAAGRRFRCGPPRGAFDAALAVNGSFWVGAAAGAALVLDSGMLSAAAGWRVVFVVGGALSLAILPLRRFVPESPRWLLLQRRDEEAGRIVADIEARAGGAPDPPAQGAPKPPAATDDIRFRPCRSRVY